jgi:hypothetical protein
MIARLVGPPNWRPLLKQLQTNQMEPRTKLQNTNILLNNLNDTNRYKKYRSQSLIANGLCVYLILHMLTLHCSNHKFKYNIVSKYTQVDLDRIPVLTHWAHRIHGRNHNN